MYQERIKDVTKKNITYVVARYNSISKDWFVQAEFDEIEEAEYYFKKYRGKKEFGIFEVIKLKTVSRLTIYNKEM